MATTMTTHHAHGAMGGMTQTSTKTKEKGALATFVGDFIEDVNQKPLQPADLAKHDMFREHINAMAILYFGFIVVLIAASLPILAYLIAY